MGAGRVGSGLAVVVGITHTLHLPYLPFAFASHHLPHALSNRPHPPLYFCGGEFNLLHGHNFVAAVIVRGDGCGCGRRNDICRRLGWGVDVGGEMIPFAGFGGFLAEVDVDGKKISVAKFCGESGGRMDAAAK